MKTKPLASEKTSKSESNIFKEEASKLQYKHRRIYRYFDKMPRYDPRSLNNTHPPTLSNTTTVRIICIFKNIFTMDFVPEKTSVTRRPRGRKPSPLTNDFYRRGQTACPRRFRSFGGLFGPIPLRSLRSASGVALVARCACRGGGGCGLAAALSFSTALSICQTSIKPY